MKTKKELEDIAFATIIAAIAFLMFCSLYVEI